MAALDDGISLREAARLLGVSRTKLWTVVKRGEIEAHPDPLDRRQRLVSRAAIERLVRQRSGHSLRPSSIGIVDDPAFQSSEAEEYMRRHRTSEQC